MHRCNPKSCHLSCPRLSTLRCPFFPQKAFSIAKNPAKLRTTPDFPMPQTMPSREDTTAAPTKVVYLDVAELQTAIRTMTPSVMSLRELIECTRNEICAALEDGVELSAIALKMQDYGVRISPEELGRIVASPRRRIRVLVAARGAAISARRK